MEQIQGFKNDFGVWRVCVWTGYAFMTVFIIFWGLMGFNLPPLAGDMPAAEMAQIYRDNANMVRFGMVMSMTFAVCYATLALVTGRVMAKMVGKDSLLVDLQVWGGGLTVVPILISTSGWLTAVYRPEALSDGTIQLLYDWSWILIDLAYSVTTVQMFALGAAIIQDKRDKPLMPKWFAWYGIWVGAMFIAECLMPFFKGGAFARQGILNFWIEFLIWFFWVYVLTFYCGRSIKVLEAEEKAMKNGQ